MQNSPFLLTVGAAEAAAQTFSYVLAVIVMSYSIARLVRWPDKSSWAGQLSKLAWGTLSVLLVVHLGAMVFPLGTVLTLRHLRAVGRRQARKDRALARKVPLAKGTPLSAGQQR